MSQADHPLPLETDVATTAARLAAGDNFLLLDCREPDEHQLVHIDGALLMPMSQMESRSRELEAYRGHDIVIHCHHGGRSLKVTRWLRDQGFPRVQSMSGGIDAWAEKIAPGMARY